MSEKKRMSPEQELKALCDFSVLACVAHVSEFTPGTDYFVAADAEVLIKSLQRTPELTGVLIDGFAGVRRPGILEDSLVFYNRTEEEMLRHLTEIPRHEHVHWMFNELMTIQDKWLHKFRAALPGKKIIYSIDSYNFDATAERMLRVIVQSAKVKVSASKKSLEKWKLEFQKKLDGFGKMKDADLQAKLAVLEDKRRRFMAARGKSGLKVVDGQIRAVKEDIALIARRETLEEVKKKAKEAGNEKLLEKTVAELVAVNSAISIKEQGLLQALVVIHAEREMLANVRGKQEERRALDVAIRTCQKEIEAVRERITRIDVKMDKLEEDFKNFREPETSPVYQRRVVDHVQQLYQRFYELGEKHDIQIVTKPEVLEFGPLVIDFANDRGRTWHPMPSRVKRLAEAYHGRMDSYRDNVAKTLEERGASARSVDVIMESGHHGTFFVRWQKEDHSAEEIRMQHVNTYATGLSDDVRHTVYVVGMPFEAQDKIAPYLNRGKPGRTRGGKVMGSASAPVFVRNSQKSVAGITIVRKHNHGLISVEAVAYDLYRNKKVLEPFKAVLSQDDSDNHLNSPEMDSEGTRGTLAMISQLMENPIKLYGQKVYIGGTLNLGDLAEANSKAWKEATKFRRPVMEMIREIILLIVSTDVNDHESVSKTALRWANDMMGGANENLKLTMRVVAWYLKEKFLSIYRHSPTRLRDILAVLEGNHFANAVRDVGIQEFTLFEQWLLALKTMHEDFPELGLKPLLLKIMAGGEPQYFQHDSGQEEMVVHLAGYGTSRQGIIENYGVGHDGTLHVQETYRVGLMHEPNAILNKVCNQNADVGKAGHTHEAYLLAVKKGDGTIRIIDQKAATQRVSATELGYGGLPRTFGVDLCGYRMPGWYWRLFIPMSHMRRIGEAQRKVEAAEEVARKRAANKK